MSRGSLPRQDSRTLGHAIRVWAVPERMHPHLEIAPRSIVAHRLFDPRDAAPPKQMARVGRGIFTPPISQPVSWRGRAEKQVVNLHATAKAPMTHGGT